MLTHCIDTSACTVQEREATGSLQLDNDDNADLTCNTTKDKTAVRATTAGVLAVMWSCGIVIGIDELIGSESRAQVYVLLMALWAVIGIIPPFFFYDDACHLTK